MPTITPILTDAATLRRRVHEKVTSALTSVFPIDLKGRTLEVKDVAVRAKEYSPDEQKRALLSSDSLHEIVKGTLVLKDAQGKVLDEAKDFTLTHIPYFTERHTMIADGNEYQMANMLRRKPGVYTQRAENGELHTVFNLSKGKNFDVTLNPEKGTLHLAYGSSSIPLYPVLRALGVPHQDISQHFGSGVAQANKAAHGHQVESAIGKLYAKIVHPSILDLKAPHETKLEEVRKKYDQTALNGDVTKVTLGSAHHKVTPKALLEASQRLLAVHNGKEDVDDADSLEFKTFMGVDDFLAERIQLTARGWAPKVKMLLNGKSEIRGNLKPAPFSDSLKKFVTTSALTAVPTGINPIELIDHAVKVTSLGEGGIPSERAIPYDARMTHSTHYGILDPIRTPESGHAGVDIRATVSAHRDEHGNLYTLVRDVKSNKVVPFAASDLHKHVVAFHGQEIKGKVNAFVHGKVQEVDAHRVQFQSLHDSFQYSPATSLIPMLRNIQGNRAIMGSKMQTQALPLVAREAPLVQVLSHDGEHSMERHYGHMTVPVSPVHGVVEKIKDGFIYIRPHTPGTKQAADNLIKVPYQTDFPFPSKTYLHHDLHVKAGDTVHEGKALGESNFTRKGTLALGLNLRTAYMPYYGYNSNDAVVISEGAAKKLTSEHMYREVYPIAQGVELSKDKHRMYYGTKYVLTQYSHLDADGVVKKGAKVNPKDLLVCGLVKNQILGTDALLGRISKTLSKPYREVVLQWDHGVPGEVVDVVRTGGQIAILIKTREQMQIGDKLAGRYGNKGVVAKIVPDHEMIHDSEGKPVELILTSAGVVSRINPAQIHEAILGKIAEKTGKPILFNNAEHKNVEAYVEKLKKEHGVNELENVYDPLQKRWIKGSDGKGVHVGRSYIFKLFKSTDTNFAGHGVGPYDINEQPLKSGGDEGAKGFGKMEFDALLAHNARNIIREASTIRGTKNDEFWRAIQLGQMLPTAKPSFAFNKFTAMLEGAGLKVDKQGSKFKLLPMTDRDIVAKSAGAIENNKTVIAKNLRPETGGLFDPRLTGGAQGTLYSHIDLHEAIPHPVFEEPIRRLLGLTKKQFDETLKEKGGNWFKNELKSIDVESKLTKLRSSLTKLHGADLNDAVKQIKYLSALQTHKMAPHDAYVISKVPVIPPVFRPIIPQPNDPSQLMIADANKLYAHLMDANSALKSTVLQSDEGKHRGMLYNAVGSVFGTHEVDNDELKGQSVKGFLTAIAGQGTPKSGFFQRKMMKKTQDVSGRGTAVPDSNLGMDEVGLPETMLWQMLDKLLVARMVRTGYPALEARRQIDIKSPAAKAALMQEIKERPVLFNRAPTLHRYSIVAAYAKPVQGKTIRVNPFIEKGLNLDYDGDRVLTTIVVKRSDLHSLSSSLDFDESKYHRIETQLEEGTMAKRLNELVPVKKDDQLYLVAIEDFPHGPLVSSKGTRDFYSVEGVEAMTWDDTKNAWTWAPVSCWSVHRNCETEIITLESGKQTFTDNDPRAVYGIDTETLMMVRRTPKEAVDTQTWVPISHGLIGSSKGIRNIKGLHGEELPLDERLGRLIGTFIGDGHVTENDYVSLAALDESIAAGWRTDLEAIYPEEAPKIHIYARIFDEMKPEQGLADSRSHRIHDKSFGQWLRPLIGTGSHAKHLPTFFLDSPESFRRGLLAGLMQTDGCISISNGKAKPQWMINYSTVSNRLARELQLLFRSLRIRAHVTASLTNRGNRAYIITPSSVDFKGLGSLRVHDAAAQPMWDRFFAEEVKKVNPAGAKFDKLPLPTALLMRFRRMVASNSSMYTTFCKAVKSGITRLMCLEFLENNSNLRTDPDVLLQRWISLIDNTSVRWDRVVSFEKTGIVEDGYDLTVPGYETFMNVEGVVLSNTLQVFAPVTSHGIEDAKKMTLSNLLLSDQSRNKLMAFPQHEAIVGVTLASEVKRDPNAKLRTFRSAEEAKAAYRRGEIKLSDPIEILHEKKASADEPEEIVPTYTTDEALSLYPAEHVTGWNE